MNDKCNIIDYKDILDKKSTEKVCFILVREKVPTQLENQVKKLMEWEKNSENL